MQSPSGENGNIPEMPENGTFPDGMTIPESGEKPEMPQGGGKRMPGGNMGFGSSSSGADLDYIDDEVPMGRDESRTRWTPDYSFHRIGSV